MEIIKNELKNEIISIKNRILDAQNECIREYCGEAPKELKKYVFDVMLSVNNKIKAYEFVNKKIMNSIILYQNLIQTKY